MGKWRLAVEEEDKLVAGPQIEREEPRPSNRNNYQGDRRYNRPFEGRPFQNNY